MKRILEQIRLFFRRLKYLFRPKPTTLVVPTTTTFTQEAPKPKEEKKNPAREFMSEKMSKSNWTPKRAQRAWLRRQGKHPLHKDHFGTYSPIPRLVGDRDR